MTICVCHLSSSCSMDYNMLVLIFVQEGVFPRLIKTFFQQDQLFNNPPFVKITCFSEAVEEKKRIIHSRQLFIYAIHTFPCSAYL